MGELLAFKRMFLHSPHGCPTHSLGWPTGLGRLRAVISTSGRQG